MVDSIVNRVIASVAALVKSDAVSAKIVSAPDVIEGAKQIKGEVIAVDNKTVTVKTDQGNIVLQSDVSFSVGQNVALKMQQDVVLILLLGNTKAETSNPVPSATLAAALNDLPEIQPQLSEFVLPDVATIKTQIVALPEALSDTDLTQFLKTVLNIPLTTELPPSVQEGLTKFQDLLRLIAQSGVIPQNITISNPTEAQMPLPVALTALFQLLKSSAGQINIPEQTLGVLQNIFPGQAISPEILLELKQQIQTSLPLIGVAVGNTPPVTTQEKPPFLFLFTSLTGQSFMALLPQTENAALAKPIFPGSVMVLAMPQQTSIPMISNEMLSLITPQVAAKWSGLHPVLGKEWPVLQELWQNALTSQNPLNAMIPLLQQTIPSPHAQHLPAAALFFLAILKNGQPGNWLSDELQLKLPGLDKANLLQQLKTDMRVLQSALQDNTQPVDSWRPLPMPLQVGTEIVRLQWFFRHPETHEDDHAPEEVLNRKKRKTRFLLDIPKTRLGDLQIDGLSQEKTLELILRTEQVLAPPMKAAIRQRYYDVLETTGLAGNINFQSGRQHYVHV